MTLQEVFGWQRQKLVLHKHLHPTLIDKIFTYNFSINVYIVYYMLMSKTISMSSLVFKASIRLLLLYLISPMYRFKKMFFLRLSSGDFDGFALLLYSVVLVSEVLAFFGPSGFVTLACAYETTCVLSDINPSTSWYQHHFSERSDPDLIFMDLSSL